MAILHWLIDAFRWLTGLAKPENLQALADHAGPRWVCYLILSAVIFSETGLLVGFFLPGDSLLFAAGFLASPAAGEVFRIDVLIGALSAAAILGDAVNFYLGLQMEVHVFERGRLRFVKHEHLMAAKAFYERHGGKAIVLARFAPFIRTFTPFVAGVARMSYRRFAIYNIAGGIGWVLLMSLAGYWLGRIAWVKEHFEPVVLIIVAISLLPVIIGGVRSWRGGRAKSDSVARPEPGDPAD